MQNIAEAVIQGIQSSQLGLAENPLISHTETHSEIQICLKNGKQYVITVEEIERCQCGAINWDFQPAQMGWTCRHCGFIDSN